MFLLVLVAVTVLVAVAAPSRGVVQDTNPAAIYSLMLTYLS